MKTVEWTTNQRDAIRSSAARTLVSASAGSGKTGVLVGRYLWLIDHPERPVSPAEILAVTFTEAAASEMRSRIREALDQRVRDNPGDARRRHDLALLDGAPISTIHSYCRSILRTDYHVLGLDPSFGVLGEEESKVLRADAVERVLEESYALAGARGAVFRDLVERYSDTNLDAALAGFIVETHDFLASLADPDEWLAAAAAPYREAASGRIGPSLERVLRRVAAQEMRSAAFGFERVADFAAAYPGAHPPKIAELRRRAGLCAAWAQAIAGGAPFDRIEIDLDFGNLPSSSAEDAKLKSKIGNRASTAKGHARNAMSLLERDGPTNAMRLVAHAAADFEVLAELLGRFEVEYRRLKDARTALDFSDLERYACRALRLRPANARQPFRHVLVDEYQDVNRAQDAILDLTAGEGEGGAALFLVGDLKQSIYRFRQAEPEVFLERMRSFDPTGTSGSYRVSLPHNHRSREAILRAVNAVFEPLMSPECGGVRYDADHALSRWKPYPGEGAADGPAVEVHLCEAPAVDPTEEPETLAEWLALWNEGRTIARVLRGLAEGVEVADLGRAERDVARRRLRRHGRSVAGAARPHSDLRTGVPRRRRAARRVALRRIPRGDRGPAGDRAPPDGVESSRRHPARGHAHDACVLFHCRGSRGRESRSRAEAAVGVAS